MLLVCTRCQGPAAYVEAGNAFAWPIVTKVTCARCVDAIFAERADEIFAGRDVFPTPLPARMPPKAQNATQSNDDPTVSVYGQQVAEDHGRASYDGGKCRACGKKAYVNFVPRASDEGKIACYPCWKAGK